MRVETLEGGGGSQSRSGKRERAEEMSRVVPVKPIAVVAHDRGGVEDQRFLQDLTTDLAVEQSGLSYVYRTLDKVVRRHHLRDLIAIVDVPPVDRQVFRSGRQPLPQLANDRVRLDYVVFVPLNYCPAGPLSERVARPPGLLAGSDAVTTADRAPGAT